jgi:hypothetical protein
MPEPAGQRRRGQPRPAVASGVVGGPVGLGATARDPAAPQQQLAAGPHRAVPDPRRQRRRRQVPPSLGRTRPGLMAPVPQAEAPSSRSAAAMVASGGRRRRCIEVVVLGGVGGSLTLTLGGGRRFRRAPSTLPPWLLAGSVPNDRPVDHAEAVGDRGERPVAHSTKRRGRKAVSRSSAAMREMAPAVPNRGDLPHADPRSRPRDGQLLASSARHS